MIPATSQRVRHSTSAGVNRQIEDYTRESIVWHAAHPQQIGRRLNELDREWDTERALEANASILAFTGTLLAATHDKRWLAVPAIVTAFLFQHAIQGWCPPLPMLRRLGFRTAREIDAERTALKALRGDFARPAKAKNDPAAALKAALH